LYSAIYLAHRVNPQHRESLLVGERERSIGPVARASAREALVSITDTVGEHSKSRHLDKNGCHLQRSVSLPIADGL
jgi:hypothetical protein